MRYAAAVTIKGKTADMAAQALAGFGDPTAKQAAARAIRRARRTAPNETDWLALPCALASDPGVSGAAKITYAALLQIGPDARPKDLAALLGCRPELIGGLWLELKRSGWLDYLLDGE